MYPPLGDFQPDWNQIIAWNAIDRSGRSDHGDGYSYGPISDRPGHEVYLKGGDAVDLYTPAGIVIRSSFTGWVAWVWVEAYGSQTVKIVSDDGFSISIDAHLEAEVSGGQHVEAGQRIGTVSGRLNYPHDHAERWLNGQPLLAMQMIEIFRQGISPIQIKRRVEPMIEHGKPTKDGWWKAGRFTSNYATLDHCVIDVYSDYDPPEEVECYLEGKNGAKGEPIYKLGKFERHATKSIGTNQGNPPWSGVNGIIWLKPIGGELLDVTVRTILK